MNIPSFKKAKAEGKKIKMTTCYDVTFARAVENSHIDAVLVGDSVAMVIYGFENTIAATVEMIAAHTAAVRKGFSGLIVADIPFLTAQKDMSDFIIDVKKLMEAGANAVKVEGVKGIESKIKALVSAGVPVMGHVGLTPQFVNEFGGFKVQGRNEKESQKIYEEAKALESLGCFALVLECVPEVLAKKITEEVTVPTIGIGAGASTDGQILVLQDLLGLSQGKFKFVKCYEDFSAKTVHALNSYCNEVDQKDFPTKEQAFL